jgi:hypothetical protein
MTLFASPTPTINSFIECMPHHAFVDPTTASVPPRHLELARQLMADHFTTISEDWRLATIIWNAIAAQTLLFTSILHEPRQEDMDLFFEDFVLRCIAVHRMEEGARD